jgi:hypothetical protein
VIEGYPPHADSLPFVDAASALSLYFDTGRAFHLRECAIDKSHVIDGQLLVMHCDAGGE